MELIKLENITKTYGRGRGVTTALHGLDLTIDTGEFVCICGASGSGKSTLLNIIGLIDRPDAGALFIDEVAVLDLNDVEASAYRNKTIGFIFQSFNLIPVLNSVENVMLPLQIRGVKDKVARQKAEAFLEEVDLQQHLKKRPDEMSGGQRQRVAIARALIMEPTFILADEPTANLDSATSENIIGLMQQFNQEKRITFVFSTHDQNLLHYSSRNVHLRDGKIIADKRKNLKSHVV